MSTTFAIAIAAVLASLFVLGYTTTRRTLTIVFCGVAIAGALALLDHPKSVRAQQTSHLQIASISVSADQPLKYPNASPTPYLDYFADEHMTFFQIGRASWRER